MADLDLNDEPVEEVAKTDDELNITVAEMVTRVEDFIDARGESITAQRRVRDYYDGKQWTDEEITVLATRKQAPIVSNRIAPKVDFLTGVEALSRTDPKAFPRTPAEEDNSEAATDAIRFVVDNNDFDQIASDVMENLNIEGLGCVTVEVEKKRGEWNITLNRFAADRFIYDEHSAEKDFKDAEWLGVITWMSLSAAERKFELDEDIISTVQGNFTSENAFDDKPSLWSDRKHDRLMTVQMCFLLEGVWTHAIFTKGAWLRKPAKSPYLDEDGEPSQFFYGVSAKVDADGNRYGTAQTFLSLQDEINAGRSKAHHIMNVRQTQGEKGTVDNVTEMKKELAKPDGHVVTNPGLGGIHILDTNDMAAAQWQRLAEAKQEIDEVGVNDDTPVASSGRQEEMVRQSRMVPLAPLYDVHKHWKKRIYEGIWMRVRQFWKEQKWIRVTDDEKNVRFVGLNQPITMGEQLQKMADNEGFEIPPQVLQDPRMNTQVGTSNEVAQIDVDIIIDESVNVVNLQSEQFESLVKLYQVNPQSPQSPQGIPWEKIIEASSLRNKQDLLDGGDMSPEEQQMRQVQQALQQATQQLSLEKAKAEVQKTQAEVAKLQSEAVENSQDARKTGNQADQIDLENQLLLIQPHPVTSVAI